ncbi:hypothetical protein RRG08_012810 [Elysia crispata]|uniref:Uncharacterized protein n=1 Tax=Elysia crispata TaxID=231223 RepID=A0AAE0XY50_9GAST|nr:hypothetical protein RRG08_012810 [Elysia crispata]
MLDVIVDKKVDLKMADKGEMAEDNKTNGIQGKDSEGAKRVSSFASIQKSRSQLATNASSPTLRNRKRSSALMHHQSSAFSLYHVDSAPRIQSEDLSDIDLDQGEKNGEGAGKERKWLGIGGREWSHYNYPCCFGLGHQIRGYQGEKSGGRGRRGSDGEKGVVSLYNVDSYLNIKLGDVGDKDLD